MPETRKPRDHLEVRCASTNRLVGWLKGIEARNVPHEPLALLDPDDAMVIEDENGVVEQTGLTMELDTMEITQTFENFTPRDMREVYRWCPSYAKRETGPMGTGIFTWVAVSAVPEDLEALFDFDSFEPWGEPDKELIAAELEFHGTQLLSAEPGWIQRNAITSSKLSGTKASFAILDEIAEMDDLMSAIPFKAPVSGQLTQRQIDSLGGLSKSLQSLSTATAPLSETLRKAAASLTKSQDATFLKLIGGQP